MAKKVLIGKRSKNHINTGGVTVGTSVVQLSTDNDRQLEGGVTIIADADNAGTVYVGVRSNLTAGTDDALDGFPLGAGEALDLPVATEDNVYLIATDPGQSIHFISF